MASPDDDATPREVRSFAAIQIAISTAIVALLFFVVGGLDEDVPPWWLIALLLLVVVAAVVLCERVWLSAEPLDPGVGSDELQAEAISAFAGQTVRKLWFCNAALGFAILTAFFSQHGAWPLVIGAVPGLLVMAFEVYPSLRSLTLTEVVLDDNGATSGLVEAFRRG